MATYHSSSWVRPGFSATAVALALTLLVPTDGSAQDDQLRRVILSELPEAEQVRIVTLAETTGEEADKLLEQARGANLAMKHSETGELFERSGQLRTPGDRRGMESFEAAGAAYFNASKPAREDGNRVRVSDMGWKACYLTESSKLSKDQKENHRQYIAVRPVSLEEAQAEQKTIRPHMWLIHTDIMNLVNAAEVKRLRAVENPVPGAAGLPGGNHVPDPVLLGAHHHDGDDSGAGDSRRRK